MSSLFLPPLVAQAMERARNAGFALSCEPGVGWLLATLAAAVPRGGQILEMGTGAGVGLAWIVHGLGARTDVAVTSFEVDPATAALTRVAPWPAFVKLETGSVLDRLDELGQRDLIFADAEGGKWEGLDRTIAALAPGGILVVDDMTPRLWMDEHHRRKAAEVRDTLLAHDDLICAELAEASGIIIATRRHAG